MEDFKRQLQKYDWCQTVLRDHHQVNEQEVYVVTREGIFKK